MPTPVSSRHAASTGRSSGLISKHTTTGGEWRCTQCEKLLGVCREGQMHLRFARGHEYFAGFPVVATCRGCGTLNKLEASLR